MPILGEDPFKCSTVSNNPALIAKNSAQTFLSFERLEQLIEAIKLEFNVTVSSALTWLHKTLNAPNPSSLHRAIEN